jgi:glycosyltransferase involved in cell wall biosynthesis
VIQPLPLSPSPMLIGIDASRAVVARRTGTERYALEIVRALIDGGPGHRFVLYFNQPPPSGLLPRTERVSWRVMPAPRLWTHARLSFELLRRPPDVLFVPAHGLPIYSPGASVVTIHDLGYLQFPSEHPVASRWHRHLSNAWSAARARRIIAVSEATRQDLIRHYRVPAQRIAVVRHGLGPTFCRPAEPARLAAVRARHGLDQPYFLFVGTLQPRKNYERLVAAFDRAARELTDPPLLALAGNRGWQPARLARALAGARRRDLIRLLDYVDDDDLPELMGGALARALPSLYEGFGLPALEAMARGTPVLASNTSSLPEVVGEAGLLVDPLDVDAIATGLVRLATDPELRAELGARGRRRAAESSWERAAAETLAVLEEAAGQRPGLC